MRRVIRRFAVVISIACAAAAFAAVVVENGGDWPESWPKELDSCRESATTFGFMWETVYQIPFEKREAFERAWPHFLKLREKGTRLILEKSPSECAASSMQAGVRVLFPDTNARIKLNDGKEFVVGPPWPDSIKSPAGELPEYVTVKDGQWVAQGDDPLGRGRFRVRLDIVLVVDGQIVDLNRIQLPADTLIVDRRF